MTVTEVLSNLLLLAAQSFPPRPEWSADEIPDLTGRVMLVTGGNTGIGKETIRALLEHNAKVYMASRNEDKARSAIQALLQDTGKEAIFLKLDLADTESVRGAVKEFLSKEDKLDVLFNNGGVMWPPTELTDARGYDLQFSTNVMGHFLLTNLLLPALAKGASSSPDKKARVINTSSGAIYMPAAGIDFETLKDSPQRRQRATQTLYYQSKLGNALVSLEMARRFADYNVISISVNPGNINSELQRHAHRMIQFLALFVLYSPAMGALTQLWAGTTPEALNCNGMFLIPWARIGQSTATARDRALAIKLWEWLEEHTGLRE